MALLAYGYNHDLFDMRIKIWVHDACKFERTIYIW